MAPMTKRLNLSVDVGYRRFTEGWHHVAIVVKNDIPTVYVDGEAEGAPTVYNRVLTDEEIIAHYKAATGHEPAEIR